MVNNDKLIRISLKTATQLDKLKLVPEETYNHVIERLLED